MSEPPVGLAGRGARLWSSLLAQDALLEDESNPMREAALQACRMSDRLDDLAGLIAVEADDDRRVKLIAAEAVQSTSVLRVLTGLRLPDEASGKRPQRRQLRGVQKPSKVSSLERARQRASGA